LSDSVAAAGPKRRIKIAVPNAAHVLKWLCRDCTCDRKALTGGKSGREFDQRPELHERSTVHWVEKRTGGAH